MSRRSIPGPSGADATSRRKESSSKADSPSRRRAKAASPSSNGKQSPLAVTLEELRRRLFEVGRRRSDAPSLRGVVEELQGLIERLEANLHLASAVEASDDSVIAQDLDGTILSWNRGAQRLFGWDAGEAVGRPIASMIADNRRAEVQAALGRVRLGERVEHLETVGLCKEGKQVPMSIALLPVRDRSGRVTSSWTLVRDAGGHRRASLVELSTEVSGILARTDLRQMLQSCCETIVRALDAALVRVWILDEERRVLELRASAGIRTGIDDEYARVPVGERLIGQVAATGQPIATNALARDAPLDEDRTRARRERLVSFAGHPLRIGERTIGVIVLFARRALDPAVIRTFGIVADAVATGVDRRRSEEALQKSEEKARAAETRLQSFFESVQIALLEAAPDGTVISANPAMARMLGYADVDELRRTNARSFYADSSERGDIVALLQRDGILLGREVRMRRKDGTLLWVRINARRRFDGRGGTLFESAIEDITVERRAEEALRQSEERFRVALAASPVRVFQLDRDLRFTWFYNAKFGDGDRFIGRTHAEVLPAVEAEAVERAARGVLKTGEGAKVEAWLSLGAERRFFEMTLEPLRDRAGEVRGVSAAAIDVTERRAMEASIRESEARLQEAQELAHLGSWEWDLVTDRATWSPEMLRLFGLDPAGPAPGQDVVLASIHPDDRDAYSQSLQRILTSEDYQQSLVRILRPGGRIRYLQGRGKAIRDPDGRPVRIAGTSQDVTEQRLADEQLRKSEAMLARAQQIAHLASWELEFEDPDDPLRSTRLKWSDEAFRMYGAEPGRVELSVELFYQTLPPEDREAVSQAVAEAVHGGKPYFVEHRTIRPDGGERTFLEQGEVVRDARGRPLRMIGTALDITDLKQAETRARDLFERLPIAIFQADPDGTIRLVNPATAAMFGFRTPAEMVGASGADLYARRSDADSFAAQLRAEGQIIGRETEFRRSDGSLFWGRMSLRVARNSQGRAQSLEATVEDITEQRKAEVRVQELFESVPIGIMETRPDGTILLVNPPTVRMFGYTRAEEMIGRDVSDLYVSPDEPRVVSQQLRKEGVIRGREVQFRRADGAPFWARLSLRLERDAQGRAKSLQATFEDLTERRRVEAALHESEARLAVALGSLPVTVFTVDREHRYTWVHNSVGPPGEDPIGKTPAELFAIEAAERMIAEQRHVFATGERLRSELPLTRDGVERVYDRTLQPLRDSEGNVIGVAGIAFDVTERKAMEIELRHARDAALEASRLKSAFLANMSHEIRTPLNVILGFTSLLEPSDDLQHEFIDSIRKASRRLLVTVQGVLDMSRMETGTFDVRLAPVDVTRVVADVVRDFEPEAHAKGLVLECRIRAAPPLVSFDEYCLRNAVGRLVENAIKFTERGSVTVTIEAGKAGELHVDVDDTGIGIAEGYLPKLFEPFTQEESGDTRSFEGTGIGLALTQRYVEKSGARVEVVSEKGKGSRFRIVIPLAASAGSPAGAATASKASPSDHSAGVLLVEDDLDNQTLVRAVLGSRYAVFVASSAAEAREALKANPKEIRAVLLDLSLRGDEDGLAFAMWVRSSGQWSRIPIIAVTAHAFPSDRRRALEAGCDDFIAKPFDRDRLLATLEGLIVP